ncbi:ATP-binding cassette domain-containing protein [Corynebacterium heidelbergense]|uniref:ATP-binding cassette domain-containing protein n=1 Tax=Corynebacterium heidelbergense TaxID=2055947 RepID=UPI001EE7383D|nr:ATP-binding cassette domain-containing protein [Corynebacterium heidelbergense]
MPARRRLIWAPSGAGLSEHAWAAAQQTGAAWVGNDAAAHVSLLRSTVAEELAVGMEQQGVPAEDMRGRVEEALRQWGLVDQADHDPAHLSTGQTRRLAIAGALLTRPAELILDCPTDGLDAAAVRMLRETLAHFPGPVTVYDRMHSGLLPGAEQLQLRPDGSLVPCAAPRWDISGVSTGGAGSGEVSDAPRDGALGPVLLELEDVVVTRGRGRWRRTEMTIGSAAIHGGQITHLAGPNGVGKTSVFLAILGLLGRGEGISRGNIRAPRTVGWAPTEMDHAILQRTVAGEVGAPEALEFAGVERWAETHPLDVPASERRMVLVAAALARGPELLLLDEPTVGLDARGHARLADVMQRYVRGEYALTPPGTRPAVLWTCHDAEFAAAVSDARVGLG